MAVRKKDGNTAGRRKATAKKPAPNTREWIQTLIDTNREQMEKDLRTIKPKDRLQILEKFMQYVLPKKQAVSADVNLEQLTDEQLDAIVAEMTKGTKL